MMRFEGSGNARSPAEFGGPGAAWYPTITRLCAVRRDRCGTSTATSGQVRVSHGDNASAQLGPTHATWTVGLLWAHIVRLLLSCEGRYHVKAGHMTFLRGESSRELPSRDTGSAISFVR